jgi:hypothetical protein
MSTVRVELLASAVGRIGGVTWHHLFLIAADDVGKQSCLRAGPECLPLAHITGRINQYGDALEDYEPSSAGPYGVITFSSGAYEPGGIDFDPVAGNVTLASANAAAQLWDNLQKAAQALQQEQIPYDPIGKGANWATMEALRRCGVKPSLPPKRWAPGVSLVASDFMTSGGPTRRVGQAAVVA